MFIIADPFCKSNICSEKDPPTKFTTKIVTHNANVEFITKPFCHSVKINQCQNK